MHPASEHSNISISESDETVSSSELSCGGVFTFIYVCISRSEKVFSMINTRRTNPADMCRTDERTTVVLGCLLCLDRWI